MKIIRFKELQELLKVSRSTLDRWEKDRNFPKRIKLGENSIGWNLEEIIKWMKEKSNEN